jgi:ABC-2 type transport system permease protein
VKTLVHYARMFGMFMRTCAVKEMEFRGSFWMGIVANIIWVSAYVVLMEVIYANTTSVGGWNKGEAVMLLGTFVMVNGLVTMFFGRNLTELPNQVRLGTFDFTLVKPVNSQFFVSMRFLNFSELGTVAAAVAMVVYGSRMSGQTITPGAVAAYLGMVLCGLAIYYSIYMILMSTTFWFIRVENLWTLGETVFQVTRFPMNIFGQAAEMAFTFLFPLIFIAHVPAQALLSVAPPAMFAIGITMAVLLVFAGARFWNYATRFYASASS